jgi:hypothetical protein
MANDPIASGASVTFHHSFRFTLRCIAKRPQQIFIGTFVASTSHLVMELYNNFLLCMEPFGILKIALFGPLVCGWARRG